MKVRDNMPCSMTFLREFYFLRIDDLLCFAKTIFLLFEMTDFPAGN